MKAIDILMNEHRHIERMLDVLAAMGRRMAAGEDVPAEDVDAALDFVRTFQDRCHHGKEEDVLFPAMEAAGIPRDGGPLGVMLTEHDHGRDLVQRLAAAANAHREGTPAAGRAFAEAAIDFGRLLRDHIFKEDKVLYPMAAQLIGGRDAELVAAFEKVETEHVGAGVHERMHAVLEDLGSRYLDGPEPEGGTS